MQSEFSLQYNTYCIVFLFILQNTNLDGKISVMLLKRPTTSSQKLTAMELLFPKEGNRTYKNAKSNLNPSNNIKDVSKLNKFFDSMGLDALTSALASDIDSVCYFSSIDSSLLSSSSFSLSSSNPPSISDDRSNRIGFKRHNNPSNGQLDDFAMAQSSRAISIVEKNARVIKWIYACGKA